MTVAVELAEVVLLFFARIAATIAFIVLAPAVIVSKITHTVAHPVQVLACAGAWGSEVWAVWVLAQTGVTAEVVLI